MCKAKGEPNYYRCEWSKKTTGRFLNMLADAGAEVTASMIVSDVDLAYEEGWDQITSTARKQIAGAVAAELGSNSPVSVRRNAAKELKQPLVHLLCAVAAAIGGACAGLTSTPADLGKEVGAEVEKNTGSKLAGRLAQVATKKLIEMTVPQLALFDQVQFLADSAAVGFCPAQQEKGTPSDHPKVVQSANRLEQKMIADMVDTLLNEDAVQNSTKTS